jgi:hypothetical protein
VTARQAQEAARNAGRIGVRSVRRRPLAAVRSHVGGRASFAVGSSPSVASVSPASETSAASPSSVFSGAPLRRPTANRRGVGRRALIFLFWFTLQPFKKRYNVFLLFIAL